MYVCIYTHIYIYTCRKAAALFVHQPVKGTYLHPYIHIYIYTYTYIHMYIYICIHNIHTYIHSCMTMNNALIFSRIHLYTYTQATRHTQQPSDMHTRAQSHSRIHVLFGLGTVFTRMDTWATYTLFFHAHRHTCIHAPACLSHSSVTSELSPFHRFVWSNLSPLSLCY